MKIEVFNIQIFPFIETHYDSIYHRNGKEFIRKLKLKEPKAHFYSTFKLKAMIDEFNLRDVITDEHEQIFVCVNKTNIGGIFCILIPASQYFKKDTLKLSTRLTKISSSFKESNSL